MEKNKLYIHVIEAKDLLAADLNGKSDPYVKIKDVTGLAGKGAKTSIKKKTLDPKWNEKFEFEFSYKLLGLCFKLFDHDTIGSDDPLGKVVIPISTLFDGAEKDAWYPVSLSSKGVKKIKGELHLKLRAEWRIPIARVGVWLPVRMGVCSAGLGWDFSKKKPPVDLDASVVAMDHTNKQLCTVSFRALTGLNGAIRHSGDNRTGEGSGDDETITLDFPKFPSEVAKVVFVINCFTGQPIAVAKSAYIRLFDQAGTMAFYRLSNMTNSSGILIGIFMKNAAGAWFFQAIGQNAPGRTVVDSMPAVIDILKKIQL